LTLIELMISIVIGLMISLMVVQYLTTSVRLFRQVGADNNLEANGSFAISYISQYIRQGGSTQFNGTTAPFFLEPCGGWDPCTFNSDAAGVSDRVAVHMFPRPLNGNPATDCVGNPVIGVGDDPIANVFYVANAVTGNPSNTCGTNNEVCSLYCRGFDYVNNAWLGNGEALIDGIDQLQVLYGIGDGQISGQQVNRYIDSTRVTNGAVGTRQVEMAWDDVRSVKLAVLVSDGANAGTKPAGNMQYQLLDSAAVNFNDRITRKVFSSTVTINNMLQ